MREKNIYPHKEINALVEELNRLILEVAIERASSDDPELQQDGMELLEFLNEETPNQTKN